MDLKIAIQILGLQNCHSPNDVKAAFRDLAHRYHPDKNRTENASDDFNRILQAYQYCLDHFEELQNTLRQSQVWQDSGTEPVPLDNFDDIFADLFGLNSQNTIYGYEPPNLIHLKDAQLLQGGSYVAKIRLSQPCLKCAEQGGVGVKLCRYCFGAGAVTDAQTQNKVVCPKCFGRGREVAQLCSSCDGFGKIYAFESFCMQLPKNLKRAQTLWLEGESLVTKQKRQLYLHIANSHYKIHENYSPLQRAWRAFLCLFKSDSK